MLEVHIPDAERIRGAGGLLPALLQLWPGFLSYLASFVTIGVIWLNHHAVFAKIAAVDRTVQWSNLLLLLTVAFIPFPNALVAEALGIGLTGEQQSTATGFYALVFTLSTVPWVVLWDHLSRHPTLLEPPYTGGYAKRERRRSLVGVVIYAVGIVVAVVAPLVAIVLFLAAAIFYALTAGGSQLNGPS